MSFITKIQLGNLGYLDIDENVSVPLNFSVAEIQDISKRQGGYSKTIKLPGTKNNNILLGQLFNVNIYDASFNQNIKTECTILQNGVPVFNGYLQLLNVVKNSPTALNPDQIKSYEVAVKDNTGDFYTSLQEKRLQDIDFSFYDHQYTLSSVTATSAYTSDDVYTYFLPNRQSGVYVLTDFTPSIYAKAYWDRIFYYAGYSYTWTGMTETGFDKLIIPYNGDIPKVDLSGNTFRAGISASTTSDVNLGVGINFLNPLFNNDTTGSNFDLNNNYDPTTGIYTSNFIGQDQFTRAFTYKITLSASTAMTQTGLGAIRLDLYHRGYIDGQFAPISDPLFYSQAYTSLSLSAGTNILETGYTTNSFITQVFNGTQIQERVEANYWANAVTWLDLSGNTIPQANWPILQVEFGFDEPNDVNNYFYNTPDSTLNEGMIVQMNQFIPTQIKQKDFIASIIKMFNLYITPNPDDETNLIIQTRDEFYDSGKTLDWTKKIDMLSEQKLQFLPDVTNKRILLSYKGDKDLYNDGYLASTGEIFGQQLYTFQNEFVQDVKKIEPIFSPTPSVKNISNNIVPAIDRKSPKNNIRILYNGGWIDGNWILAGSGGTFTNISGFFTNFTKYPYAGHFDNPYIPSIDIDFGTNDYEMYNDWNYITNNNLYNKYYKRQISQIESGKLLTAKFNLNEYDINNIDFRDRIFIHDTYWFLNKIVDYNANIDGSLTTVELINVDEGLKFSPTQTDIETIGGFTNIINNEISLGTVKLDNTIGSVNGTDILGGQDNTLSDGTVRMRIAGNSNNTAVINGEIVGDLNSISGSDLFVHGYGNTIAGPANNVSIQGNLNTLSSSTENINIFGSGNTLGYNTGNIGLYNSSNNNVGNFVSGATLINSNNVTIASDVTNVVVLNANGITITGSNQTYTSSGSSSVAYFEVTWTDLTTILIPGNLLQVGALYKIDTEETTWKNNGLFLQAISTNQLEKIGIVLFLAPSTYQTITDGYGNNWLGIWDSSLTPSIGDLVIWGGLVWSNVNGLVGAATDDFTLDSEWNRIDKDSFSNNEYTEIEMTCQYDVINDWVERQWDGNGNEVGLDFITHQLILGNINRCEVSDWNFGTLGNPFYENKCSAGFYNNRVAALNSNECFSIYSNRIISGGVITGNKLGDYSIYYNVEVSIFGNKNNGEISNNGQTYQNFFEIYYNTNKGSISYNENTGGSSLYIRQNYNNSAINTNEFDGGYIQYNGNDGQINNNISLSTGESIEFNTNSGGIGSNQGPIRYNSNNGEISSSINIQFNSNNGYIDSNTCPTIGHNSNLGNINSNTNIDEITHNSNNGSINGNDSNINLISYNSNGGYISNNTGTGGPWNISNNINNGYISGTLTADVTDTIVNK
jgi:hypothetical protein